MSRIEWTDKTWNPVRGCSRVSEGCRNCYAERFMARDLAMNIVPRQSTSLLGGEWDDDPPRFAETTPSGPRWTGIVKQIPEKLDEPLRWQKPQRVFVNSMSDLFHEALSDDAIRAVFSVMANAHLATGEPSTHQFQVLTKRPARMLDFMSRLKWQCGLAAVDISGRPYLLNHMPYFFDADWVNVGPEPGPKDGTKQRPGWVPPNVWLGVSVEDQATADERIPPLLQTPAAVRFVSIEPMLGTCDLRAYLPSKWLADLERDGGARHTTPTARHGAKIDWVIVAGESGPNSRPCDIAWIRSVVRECKAAGVPCYVRQLGALPVAEEIALNEWPDHVRFTGNGDRRTGRIHLFARKGADPSEWPEDLRVREWPEVR